MNILSALADEIISRLVWAAGQATVLIAVLWLIMRCLPRLSPAIRCMLWWLVALQLVLGLAISTPVQLHWLKPAGQAQALVEKAPVVQTVENTNAAAPVMQAAAIAPQALSRTAGWNWTWTEVALLLWLSVVLLQAALAARQWLETRALLREASPATTSTLQALCTQQARALGMHSPALRVSEAIVSPLVAGLWRPVVLLPAEQTLSPEELSMAIAHELAHVRRGDLWLGWVPAIAQRLFFFHPLVNWAMREYGVYREAACDAQVLRWQGATPHHYGHLLVRLGVVDPMHTSLAGASSTFLHLKRRLIMLQQSVNETTPRLRSWLLVAAVALIGILPYRVTAKVVEQRGMPLPPTASVPVTPVTPPTPPTPVTPATPPTPDTPRAPPVPPAPAAPKSPGSPPPPPPPPAPPIGGAESQAHYVHTHTHNNATRGLYLYDGELLLFDGDENDQANIAQFDKSKTPTLWFRNGTGTYVSHDADLINRAVAAYAPVRKLSTAQSTLADEQSALAGQESALAERESALAEQESRLAASIATQRGALVSATAQEKAALEADLKKQEGRLHAMEADIEHQRASIQQAHDHLEQQAKVLSERQVALSTQETGVTQQARQHLDALLDQAAANGLAKPVNQ